jgi:hypothetical protein
MRRLRLSIVAMVRYFCPIWTEFLFSGQILVKTSNIKFHENVPLGVEMIHEGGQTQGDRIEMKGNFIDYA